MTEKTRNQVERLLILATEALAPSYEFSSESEGCVGPRAARRYILMAAREVRRGDMPVAVV